MIWNSELGIYVTFGVDASTETWIWDGAQWLQPGWWSDWEWVDA